jgi:hypothetical protein
MAGLKNLVCLLLLGLSHQLWAQDYLSTYTFDDRLDDQVSIDSFWQNIENQNTQTLEEALELLPNKFFENYVLMYRSRSLQESSFLFPRAIVFGQTARFILSFNGHPKQRGYDNLEIVQFREDTHSWEFREITFYQDRSPHLSEANPRKCLECHQSPRRQNVDPRPNWEPYNFWPGAYASLDSEIRPLLYERYQAYLSGQRQRLPRPMERFLPQDLFLAEEQGQEQSQLERFESLVKEGHPRYQHLGPFNVRSPLNLTKATTTYNMRRLARLAREELGEELFSVYKYALLGLGDAQGMVNSRRLPFACGQLYLPDTIKQTHIEQALQTRHYEPNLYIKPERAMRWKVDLAAGLDILLAPLGIDTTDWSMDFRTQGRFSFRNRYTSPHHSPTHWRDAMEIVYDADPALQLNCQQLSEHSEQALAEYYRQRDSTEILNGRPMQSSSPSQPLIRRCISCHVEYMDGGQAPYIPFDNFDGLKPLLNQGQYARGTLFDEILYRTSDHAPLEEQMPPSGQVPNQARDQFIQSLMELMD